ncbi:hypothetical protein XELAEV_180262272mg, partial [Xenopus laevis]
MAGKGVSLNVLRHEAEFYGITPLVKRLLLCEELERSSCGSVLFHGYLPPPAIPRRKFTCEASPSPDGITAPRPCEGGAQANAAQPTAAAEGMVRL